MRIDLIIIKENYLKIFILSLLLMVGACSSVEKGSLVDIPTPNPEGEALLDVVKDKQLLDYLSTGGQNTFGYFNADGTIFISEGWEGIKGSTKLETIISPTKITYAQGKEHNVINRISLEFLDNDKVKVIYNTSSLSDDAELIDL